MGWRYIGSAIPAASTVDAYLDTIVTLMASVTYADTSARVPGVGYAWSLATSEGTPREAISLVGPTGCGHTARVVLAGKNVAYLTPVMAAPDAWSVGEALPGQRLIGLVGIGGTLSGWAGATPLGPGIRLTGYTHCGVYVHNTPGALRIWESKKGICIYYKNGTSFSCSIHGAWVIPWNPTGASGAEPDGHLYGSCTTGSNSTMVVDEDGSTYDPTLLLKHVNNPTRAHIHVLQPGTPNIMFLEDLYVSLNPINANSHKTLDGEWVRQRIPFTWLTTRFDIGYAHDIGHVPRDVTGAVRYDGVNPSYYCVAASDSVSGEAFGLFHDET